MEPNKEMQVANLWDCKVALMLLLFLEQCGVTRDFWRFTIVGLVTASHRAPALTREAGKT